MSCSVKISFLSLDIASSLKKENNANLNSNQMQASPLSSKWSLWGVSQLHLLGPPKRPQQKKPHSGALFEFHLENFASHLHMIISAKPKCHTRQGLYSKFKHWEITHILGPCWNLGAWPSSDLSPFQTSYPLNKKRLCCFNLLVCVHICTSIQVSSKARRGDWVAWTSSCRQIWGCLVWLSGT